MKICKKCQVSKSEEEFSSRKGTKDGLKYECRECNNKRCKDFLKNTKNREKSNKRSSLFYKNNKEHCKQIKKIYYEENRIDFIKRVREYNKDPENRVKRREWSNAYKKKQVALAKAKKLVNEDYKKRQISAHGKVHHALKLGKLIKPENCQNCGEKTDLEGHHEDYSKPLQVVWLCKICHCRVHGRYVDVP